MTTWLLHTGLKIMFVGMLIGVWAVYVDPVADQVTAIIGMVFNMALYRLIPREAFLFLAQVVTFVSSLGLLLWIVAPPGLLEKAREGEQPIEHAPGFTSSPVYHD